MTKKEYLECFKNFTLVFKNKSERDYFMFVLDDTIKANPAPDEQSPECWRNILADIISNKFAIPRL